MPVLAPGEVLEDTSKMRLSDEDIDKLNKRVKKKKKRRRRKKPKWKVPKKKKKKEVKKNPYKLIGFHKICLKWIIGVIVNRHFRNKLEWQY